MTHTIERWIVVHRSRATGNLLAATFHTKELALAGIDKEFGSIDDPIALLPWNATFEEGDGLEDKK